MNFHRIWGRLGDPVVANSGKNIRKIHSGREEDDDDEDDDVDDDDVDDVDDVDVDDDDDEEGGEEGGEGHAKRKI